MLESKYRNSLIRKESLIGCSIFTLTYNHDDILVDLALRIKSCSLCKLSSTRLNTVPGEGNPKADIMFIGEAPGQNEDREGRPFIGRAGNILDRLLESVYLSRKDVYITNMLKCRPPENRDPSLPEIKCCSDYLDQQISFIDPQVIVTLGRFSFGKFFPDKSPREYRGSILDWYGRKILPMYHPAAALYNPSLIPRLMSDFNKLTNFLADIPVQDNTYSDQLTSKPTQLKLFE